MEFLKKACLPVFLFPFFLSYANFAYSQTSPGLITNITASSTRSYTLGELTVGSKVYTDRLYQATSVPSILNNAPFIKTPNDDKGNKLASLLNFTLTQNATVYVAYDPRGNPLPAWLNGWQKINGAGGQLGINDPTISYLQLFSKSFLAGKVTLGGTLASPAAGAKNSYLVIAQTARYNLTITTSGNGTASKNPDLANYAAGTSVSVTATPAAGQQFSGWSGDASGTANPLTIVMNGNKSVTAIFTPIPLQYALTVNVTGNGTITKNPDQNTYTEGSSVSLTATPAAGQQFSGWSGDASGTANPLTIVMNGNKAVTAIFTPIPLQYALTVSVTGNGTVTKNPDQNTYTEGSSVSLTATPAAGQQFSGWSGDASGTANPLTIVMNGNKAVTAIFTPIPLQYALTVNVTGNGSVAKTPDQNTYIEGSSVSLTATPAAGQQFSGWSGDASGSANPLTVIMDAAKSITATFTPIRIQYTLVVGISGEGAVTKTPEQNTYTEGSSVSVTATPAVGHQFSGWSGDASGMGNPLAIIMDANKSITATFTPIPPEFNLVVKVKGEGTVTKSPDQNTYLSGSSVVLTANPSAGHQFSGWSGDVSSTVNPLTITVDADKVITATFTPVIVQYSLNVAISGNGTVSKSPDQSTYPAGSSVTLTASPAAGHQFSGWSGAAGGFENPLIITMDGDKAVTATFTLIPAQYALNLIISGNGTVTKSPDQATYEDGTSVVLTASPAANQQFIGWSGAVTGPENPLKITMDADKTITATFQAIAPALTFDPNTLHYSAVQNQNVASQSVTLSANTGLPSVSLTKSPNTDWLTLPSPALGSLNFSIDHSGLNPGTYNSTVIASANSYANAILQITLIVSAGTPDKSVIFTQSSQTAEVEQGNSQTLLEYIVTSDNVPTNAQLTAVDESANIPAWLTVNGNILNGINYTTGSEITFNFDATNLSIGTYSAVVTASAAGYDSAVLNIFLTVKAGTGGALTSLKVNFQDSLTVPPLGWVKDFGQPFGLRTSPYQDNGYTYGWIKRVDNTPVDLTKNGRKRSAPSDILLATLMHMQGGDVANFPGSSIEGVWEIQVSNGNYDVTVSVGDNNAINSTHAINVEGASAISGFVPTSTVKFKSATVTVSVTDGFLTITAIGGVNTKINYVIILPSTSKRPSVVLVNPENSSQNVSENTSISTSILKLPNAGINNLTINTSTVFLTEESTGIVVPSNVNGTGGGDAITLVPSAPLKLSTTYNFNVTSGVQDLSGAAFIPYASTFKTGSGSTGNIKNAKFDRVVLPGVTGQHSSLTMGPDGKLYALSIDGMIKRFAINADGTLAAADTLYALQDAYGARGPRLAIGLAFDPSATATNLVAWVTHSSFVFLNGPQWDGKLSKLSGNNLQIVKEVLINLPRSAKDHVTNSIAFGPDGALYFTQGSMSAMGRADNTWSNRDETLLSGAVLRLDISKLGVLPLNVKTADGGGTYNPYAVNAPLTIYASGVRNAYDLVWHSNGNLYVATNGSAAGGNTPASVAGTIRTDGSPYNGPVVPALSNVQQTQKDFLFRVVQGGYYGHPNLLRGEYVINGGNPTSIVDPAQVNAYPLGTMPDVNWRGYSFDFQNNKSPNGAIEYKSNAFNGALKGKLLIVRYSQNDDIITLGAGGTSNDIISSTEGNQIPGFSGFVDPLDLTEDASTGNIYVSEYGGDGKIVLLRVNNTTSPVITIAPLADAFVRGGSYAAINYGTDTSLLVKSSLGGSNKRSSYLKFPLDSFTSISSAKLRLYGRNTLSTESVNISAFGINDDSWTETGITFNNAPPAADHSLSFATVNNQAAYYEFDVTNFVKAQLAGDKIASFMVKDSLITDIFLRFNSKQNEQNRPQLVITAIGAQITSNPTDTMARRGTILSSLTDLKNAEKWSTVTNSLTVNSNDSSLSYFSMAEASGSVNDFEKPKVYPNPLYDKFNIDFPPNYKGNFEIHILDVQGKAYRIAKTTLKPGGSTMEVNVSPLQLKAGIYILKIFSGDKAESVKLLIRK